MTGEASPDVAFIFRWSRLGGELSRCKREEKTPGIKEGKHRTSPVFIGKSPFVRGKSFFLQINMVVISQLGFLRERERERSNSMGHQHQHAGNHFEIGVSECSTTIWPTYLHVRLGLHCHFCYIGHPRTLPTQTGTIRLIQAVAPV